MWIIRGRVEPLLPGGRGRGRARRGRSRAGATRRPGRGVVCRGGRGRRGEAEEGPRGAGPGTSSLAGDGAASPGAPAGTPVRCLLVFLLRAPAGEWGLRLGGAPPPGVVGPGTEQI